MRPNNLPAKQLKYLKDKEINKEKLMNVLYLLFRLKVWDDIWVDEVENFSRRWASRAVLNFKGRKFNE